MILSPDTWVGRGSWRVTTDSTGVKFECVAQIKEESNGTSIAINVLTETDTQLKYDVWVVPDETGLYTITVNGADLDLEGIGKLESLPHLATLKSTNGEKNLVVSVFEMPEVYGTRGFFTQGPHTFTFELALRMRVKVVQEKNDNVTIIPFNPRQRGN